MGTQKHTHTHTCTQRRRHKGKQKQDRQIRAISVYRTNYNELENKQPITLRPLLSTGEHAHTRAQKTHMTCINVNRHETIPIDAATRATAASETCVTEQTVNKTEADATHAVWTSTNTHIRTCIKKGALKQIQQRDMRNWAYRPGAVPISRNKPRVEASSWISSHTRTHTDK